MKFSQLTLFLLASSFILPCQAMDHDGERHIPVKGTKTALTSNSANPDDLMSHAADIVTCQSVDKDSSEKYWSGKDYHVTASVLPLSEKNMNDEINYYFWVGLQYSLTPYPSKDLGNGKNIKDTGIASYVLSIAPRVPQGYEPPESAKSNMKLVVSSPGTTQGTTTISSSITHEFGANIGFFGETPTAGTNTSYSISNSKSYSIQDASVTLETTGSKSTWKFDLQESSQIAKSTFQPYVQLLWILPKSDADTMYPKKQNEKRYLDIVAQFNAVVHTQETVTEEYGGSCYRDPRSDMEICHDKQTRQVQKDTQFPLTDGWKDGHLQPYECSFKIQFAIDPVQKKGD